MRRKEKETPRCGTPLAHAKGATVTQCGQEDDSKPKLFICAVLSVEGGEDATAGEGGSVDTAAIRTTMQKLIKSRLNPLFGISDVVTTTALPRTASNKVMRRVLRDGYKAK